MRKFLALLVAAVVSVAANADVCMPELAEKAANKFIVRVVAMEWEPGDGEEIDGYAIGKVRVKYRLLERIRGNSPTDSVLIYPLYPNTSGLPQLQVATDYVISTHGVAHMMVRGCGFVVPIGLGNAAYVAERIRSGQKWSR
jgi:hypothetical protein